MLFLFFVRFNLFFDYLFVEVLILLMNWTEFLVNSEKDAEILVLLRGNSSGLILYSHTKVLVFHDNSVSYHKRSVYFDSLIMSFDSGLVQNHTQIFIFIIFLNFWCIHHKTKILVIFFDERIVQDKTEIVEIIFLLAGFIESKTEILTVSFWYFVDRTVEDVTQISIKMFLWRILIFVVLFELQIVIIRLVVLFSGSHIEGQVVFNIIAIIIGVSSDWRT